MERWENSYYLSLSSLSICLVCATRPWLESSSGPLAWKLIPQTILEGPGVIFYKKKFIQSLWVGLHKYNNSLLRPCTFLQIGFWRSPKVPSICDGVEQRQCGDASCWGQSGCWEDLIKQWEIPPHIFYHFIILLVYTLSFLDIVFGIFFVRRMSLLLQRRPLLQSSWSSSRRHLNRVGPVIVENGL